MRVVTGNAGLGYPKYNILAWQQFCEVFIITKQMKVISDFCSVFMGTADRRVTVKNEKGLRCYLKIFVDF